MKLLSPLCGPAPDRLQLITVQVHDDPPSVHDDRDVLPDTWLQYSGIVDLADGAGVRGWPADLLGDWREDVVLHTTDNSALRILVTTALTDTRLYTLLHDPQYRLSIAWQNVAYNQPQHPSFFLGDGMKSPPHPSITTTSVETGGR